MSRAVRIPHLARVEGHGGITVTLDGHRVEDVTFDIFEGARLFEGVVRGRRADDVPALVSRICAICSHAHTVTALMAMEAALGVVPSPQTRRLRDLGLHGENIESHALHLFALALPDLLGYPGMVAMAREHRDLVVLGLRLKKLGNTIQEIVGGRAVHPVNYVLGGFGRLPSDEDLLLLDHELADGLEACRQALERLRDTRTPVFAEAAIRVASLVPDADLYFFGDQIQFSDGARFRVEGYPHAIEERCVTHSHAKHSLHDGHGFMVGALARLAARQEWIGRQARTAAEVLGLVFPPRNILANNIAQLVELVFSVETARRRVREFLGTGLVVEPPPAVVCRAGSGVAATEAPRGMLFHHYVLDDDGRVAHADVITPTAQNLHHAEEQLRAVASECPDRASPPLEKRLEMTARAYDPCISCSVHLIRMPRGRRQRSRRHGQR